MTEPTSPRYLPTPTSRCGFGVSRCEITPPVGIYHRFWGAAKHDRATGVHRRLTGSVLVLDPVQDGPDGRQLLVALDHCLFRPDDMDELLDQTSRRSGVDSGNITFAFSHTHSGGNICRQRVDLPGGNLIGPYLDELPEKIAGCFQQATENLQTAVLTYGTGTCRLGQNRDYWDARSGQYVCGFNPGRLNDLPVRVVRATGDTGQLLATIVNYACHPTTLAWDNTLISPDYVGAMRETIEECTGAPCVFFQAPSGDIGPRHGYVGDPQVADQNGRQLGFAALSAWESLPPPGTEFHYVGPVLSGATVGYWEHRPQSPQRRLQAARFQHRRWNISLPFRDDLPTIAQTEAALQSLLDEESAASQRGEEQAARDARALAERKRRLLERLGPLPQAAGYPYTIDVRQFGDAFWIALEGEPYHAIDAELTRRFPENPLILMALADGSRPSYLPRREDYEKPLYQVDVSLLAPGCLEAVTESVAAQIQEWLAVTSGPPAS